MGQEAAECPSVANGNGALTWTMVANAQMLCIMGGMDSRPNAYQYHCCHTTQASNAITCAYQCKGGDPTPWVARAIAGNCLRCCATICFPVGGTHIVTDGHAVTAPWGAAADKRGRGISSAGISCRQRVKMWCSVACQCMFPPECIPHLI